MSSQSSKPSVPVPPKGLSLIPNLSLPKSDLPSADSATAEPVLDGVLAARFDTFAQQAWHVMAWHGVVWRGVVWHGVAWHGVAWRSVAV